MELWTIQRCRTMAFSVNNKIFSTKKRNIKNNCVRQSRNMHTECGLEWMQRWSAVASFEYEKKKLTITQMKKRILNINWKKTGSNNEFEKNDVSIKIPSILRTTLRGREYIFFHSFFWFLLLAFVWPLVTSDADAMKRIFVFFSSFSSFVSTCHYWFLFLDHLIYEKPKF